MRRRTIALLCLLAGLWAMSASAQDNLSLWDERYVEATPFVGLRFGGGFDPFDRIGGENDVERDFVTGLFLDIDMWNNSQLEFLYSRSEMEVDPSAACPCVRNLGITAEYLHVGWLEYWNWRQTRTFLVTSGGVTFLDSDPGRFADSTVLSAALGGGLKIPVTDRLGVRFDARAYANFVDEDDGAFCDSAGSCLMRHGDSVLWQFEATAGIVFTFGKRNP